MTFDERQVNAGMIAYSYRTRIMAFQKSLAEEVQQAEGEVLSRISSLSSVNDEYGGVSSGHSTGAEEGVVPCKH